MNNWETSQAVTRLRNRKFLNRASTCCRPVIKRHGGKNKTDLWSYSNFTSINLLPQFLRVCLTCLKKRWPTIKMSKGLG